MASASDSGGEEGEGRIRVLLLLSSLHGGGAERVAVHLLNHCDSKRFDVRIGLLRKAGPFLKDADASRVTAPAAGERLFVFEGHNSGFYRPDRLLAGIFLAPFAFRRMVREFRPHVAMSFLKGTSLITYAALAGLGRRRPRWIAREGNNTLAVIGEELSGAAARGFVRRLTVRAYRAADVFLANSNHMAEGLRADLGLDRKRVRMIHNPIDLAEVRRLAAAPVAERARPYIVNVGRLEYQKGHDLLLRAFAASAACRGHDLVLLGRGSKEAELRALAAELGIADRVLFEGFTANPWPWVARARLFVLSSRWEGFPTAVAEALACGTPALVTDCRFGPREVVEHGVSGWVVPPEDAEALREAMDLILGDPALAATLARNGLARVESFGLDEMVRGYENLFAEQAAA